MEQIQHGLHHSTVLLLGQVIWLPSLSETLPALCTHLLLTKAKLLHQCKPASFTASPSAVGEAAGRAQDWYSAPCSAFLEAPSPNAVDLCMTVGTSLNCHHAGVAGKHQPHWFLKPPGLGIAPPSFPVMAFSVFRSVGKMDA